MLSSKSKKEPLSLERQIEKRALFRFVLLLEIILLLLTSCVLKPLYISINSDVLLRDGALPYILELVILLFNILFFTFPLASSAYALIRFNACRPFLWCFLALSFAGKIVDLIATLAFNKTLQAERFWEVGSNFLLEALLFFVILLILSRMIKTFEQKKKALLRLKSLSKSNEAPAFTESPLYPFQKLYAKDNLLQRCALAIGIILPCSMLVFNLLNDITYMILYGVSEFFKILLDMLLYYALDLLMAIPVALISYLASLLLFAHCFKKKEQI